MATILHPFDDTEKAVLPSYQKSSVLPSGQKDLDNSNFFWNKWRCAGAVALLWLALSYALHVPTSGSSSQQMGLMTTDAEGILPSSTASVPLLGKSNDDSNHYENHHTDHHTDNHNDHHNDDDKVTTKESENEEKKRQKEEKEAIKTREKDVKEAQKKLEKVEKKRQKEGEKAQEKRDKENKDKQSKRPHILFILVDDLGWGDVGFHYESDNVPLEIQTPVMNQLVREGIQLDRHYVHSTCTGTRVALQSGRFPVHVQTSLKSPEDPSSGMPRNMTGMAEHLQQAGYRTHYVGKWDVGMATPKHTPKGRGYDTSLNYFEHKNDYWTQQCAQSSCCHAWAGLSRWEGPETHTFYNLTLVDLWDTTAPATTLNGTDYEEFIFMRRMFEIIDHHDPDDAPLFLMYAPHVAHCPLQVPQEYLDRFDFMDNDTNQCQLQTANIIPQNESQPPYNCRRQFHAMVNLLDEILGNITDRFRQSGMYDDLLIVFTSDNGGSTHLRESGSTNFPLRGGKYTDFEGGVRAAAFVSGGYISPHLRGTLQQEPIHICDWYATLNSLAGITPVHDNLAAVAGLPPVDAVNVWPLLTGLEKKSPRQEIPLSSSGLIVGDYKLIWNEQVKEAGWTGPQYPNASSTDDDVEKVLLNCSSGCLFNVVEDRGEHVDLASQRLGLLQHLKARLVELRRDFFENDDVGNDSCPPDIDMPCACWAALNYYGGYFGPYQEVDHLGQIGIDKQREQGK